jgi:hypothetical protein
MTHERLRCAASALTPSFDSESDSSQSSEHSIDSDGLNFLTAEEPDDEETADWECVKCTEDIRPSELPRFPGAPGLNPAIQIPEDIDGSPGFFVDLFSDISLYWSMDPS